MALLELSGVKKLYTGRYGLSKVLALNGVTFNVEKGEYVAVMGESGSGKTTLLNILAAIDRPTAGRVLLEGRDIGAIGDSELALFRRQNLGFVFQEFNLLDTFTVKDNILLPLVLSGADTKDMLRRLRELAVRLEIDGILDKYPYEISGGQKQRAAAARALITQPRLILADEPTGALDSRSSGELLKLFSDINRAGQTIVMVTHSVNAASHAGRVLFIRDGVIFHELYRGDNSEEWMYEKITHTLTMLRGGGETE